MKYEHKSRDGQPFTIYALVCPRDMCVRYVGQTTKPLSVRLREHVNAHKDDAVGTWLRILCDDKPLIITLESGVNQRVRWRSSRRLTSNGHGGLHGAPVRMWLSTIRETVWQKRFRRTLLNAASVESVEVDAVLLNPKLPWCV